MPNIGYCKVRRAKEGYGIPMVLFKWDRLLSELWIYAVVFGIVYALYVLRDYIRNVRFVLQLDGPKTVPILGNAHSILEDNLLHRLAHEVEDYGRIFRIWVTWVPYVFLSEPEDVKAVLSSAKHTRKVFFYKLLDNFIGKGLITRDVDSWSVYRRLLQPAFHRQNLEGFTAVFAEHADRLVDNLLETDGQDTNVAPYINDTVYDILSEIVLGVSRSANRKYSQHGDDGMPFRNGQVMVPYRLTRPWLLLNWVYSLTKAGRAERKQRRNLFDTCRRLVKEKREIRRENESRISDGVAGAAKTPSLLEYMVEINEKNPCFTDEDIIEECCTFMLAGQDSVGTATAMTLFLLANHREWQEKCREELDRIFRDDSARSPTIKDFNEMKNLEMCIKESLRLYPSVPLFARTLGEDLQIGKYVVPAGCSVIVAPYSTHRLSEHFPDPHAFRPERFSLENSEKRHPYAYLPFSAGPRNCIGNKFAMLEMKSTISAVMRKCILEPVPGKQQVKPKYRMTVRAQGGLWIKITNRER